MMRMEPGQKALSQDAWKAIALDSLCRHLSLPEAKVAVLRSPTCVNVSIDRNAIPQYTVGHSRLVANIKNTLRRNIPSLHLVGNSWGGVGVNDSIENTYRTVQTL